MTTSTRRAALGAKRLILWLLTMREVRMAYFELARSEMLYDDAEAAFVRSRCRMEQANRFARRAGWRMPPLAP